MLLSRGSCGKNDVAVPKVKKETQHTTMVGLDGARLKDSELETGTHWVHSPLLTHHTGWVYGKAVTNSLLLTTSR